MCPTREARRPKYARSLHDVSVAVSSTSRLSGPWTARAEIRSLASSISTSRPARVHPEPAQRRIGRRPTVRLLVQAGDRAVVDDAALLVAPRCVVDAADRELARVARDHAVDERCRVRAGDEILVERRDVDQGGRLADGVVLDLVRVVVGACGEIARPLPPLQLAVERLGAGMERGSDGHGERFSQRRFGETAWESTSSGSASRGRRTGAARSWRPCHRRASPP